MSSTSTSSVSSSSSRSGVRRWVTRGAVVAAGLGIAAGAMAPAASAVTQGIHERGGRVVCVVNHDVQVGPLYGGQTFGNCRMGLAETSFGTPGSPDTIALGQVFLPGGVSYSAWIDKVW